MIISRFVNPVYVARIFIGILVLFTKYADAQRTHSDRRPNIILIITDDQGYGDFAFTGNPYVKTPNIDKLASRSTRLTNFHQSPVCAPTRASLLTGRYHQRTGVHDTYNNGAIMSSEETTLAELLTDAGYSTGVVGKWHLGENYGYRPSEQGFQYSLVHHGGGIGQPGDHIDNFIRTDSCYFDPVLFEDNKLWHTKGYCSDVFTDAAINYLKVHRQSPFFLYLSFNAPHTPLQVPQPYLDRYIHLTFDEPIGKPGAEMTDKDKEDARRAYAMITNVDDNIGRLLTEVKRLGLDKNTIIVFTTDNGNQQRRYNAGLKGLKSSVYEGGTKVVNLISFQGTVPENQERSNLSAHIDMLPTLLEATGTNMPANLKIDGRSLWPIIRGKKKQSAGRSLYNAWSRGWPEPYRNAAFYRDNLKLVALNAEGDDINSFELYDLSKDPSEQNNIIASEQALALKLKAGMDSVYADIVPNTHLYPQRIQLGNVHENPVMLTRQDWAGIGARNWNADAALGVWTVSVKADGYYDFSMININPVKSGTLALIRLGQIQRSRVVKDPLPIVKIEKVYLKAGDYEIESWFEHDNQVTTPYYLEILKQP